MKVKTARRAFGASLLALILCFAMLVGTTFAWFTDTASTEVNNIVSGILQIDLAAYDGEKYTSLNGEEPLTWNKGQYKFEGEEVLWEPGVTYDLDEFYIVNKDLKTQKQSNLALKYRVEISGILGDAKLLEAIDFTISYPDGTGSTKTEELANFVGTMVPTTEAEFIVHGPYTITGHMKEDAGNEYQDLSIDGIAITVYATQYTYEYDTTTNQYDAGAPWTGALDKEGLDANTDDVAKTVVIKSAEQLAAFAEAVNGGNNYAGYTVTLEKDIDLNNVAWTPINAGNWGMTFNGNGHTIKNLKVSGEKNVGLFGTFTGNTMKDLTVDGATVTGINHVAALAGDGVCGHFDNCTVKNATITTSVKNNDDGDKAGAIVGYLSAEPTASCTNCTVEDCTIQGYRDVGAVVGYANGAAVVTGNTVNNVTLINDRSNNYKSYTTDAAYDVNEVVGEAVAAATVSNNTATNVTKTIKN